MGTLTRSLESIERICSGRQPCIYGCRFRDTFRFLNLLGLLIQLQKSLYFRHLQHVNNAEASTYLIELLDGMRRRALRTESTRRLRRFNFWNSKRNCWRQGISQE